MFTPNVAQKDYLLDYAFTATNSSTYGSAVANRGITAVAYCEETYGLAYDPTNHGFKTTLTTQTTTFGVSSYSVSFESPWWSGVLLSSASLFLGTCEIQIELDGVEHNAGCNAWSFSFDELRIYSVGGGGSRTLLHTIAGDSDSGTGYDPRYDCSHPYSQCNPYLDSTGGIPNCTDYATRANYIYSIDVASTFAGFWKWRTSAGPGSYTEDDITLASASTPTGNVGCSDCDGAVQSPTGSLSYHMALSSGVTEGISYTDLPDINCYCPGDIFSYHMHYWRFDFARDQKDYQEAWLAPKTFSIRAHDVRIVEECDENGSTSSYDHTDHNTDTECISIWNSQRYKKAASRWCSEQYGLITPCAVEPGHEPVDATCDVIPPSPVYCYYGCQVLMEWPTKPPCTEGGCRQSMDVDYSFGTHIKSLVTLTGDVEIRTAPNSAAPLVWTLQNTLALGATSACIRIDRGSIDQTIYLDVEILGTIYTYTAARADGAFTLATTIGTGGKPLRIIGRDGRFFLYWIDGAAIKGEIRDRAGNIIFSTFTVVASGVDDDCLGGDEDQFVDGDGVSRRVILDSVESGSVVERTSDDGVTFV